MTQRVVITGAAQGLGAAIARAFAAIGADLVLIDRDADGLSQITAQTGGRGLSLTCDLSDAAQTDAAIAQFLPGPPIDTLIHNAGILRPEPIEALSLAMFTATVNVGLQAAFQLTKAVWPAMRQHGGALVFVSSQSGIKGFADETAYCAAKFGLAGYGDALRAEVGHLGLQVHNIYPGSVRTDVSRNALSADGERRGVSDKVIDNGIEPAVAVAQMIDEMLAGQREIIVAEGAENAMGEARRTPDALLDQIGAFMAAGYVQRMNEGAQ